MTLPQTMSALHLAAGHLCYVADYPVPTPGPGEVLVRVRLAGICATDLELAAGYVPGFDGVPGHEFVGVVAAPDAKWHGQRVVASINVGCGACAYCRRDEQAHCPQRQAIGIHNWDGAFAEYVRVPVANLHLVPETVVDETAVFAEPLAAALRIREQIVVPPSASVAVVGPGRLGLLVAQVLAQAGTAVTVFGRRQATLALPASLGLRTALTADVADNCFDFVVEATGNDGGFAEALRLVRSRGTLVLKSTFAGKSNLNLTKLVVDEINLVGSRCGPFAPALRLMAAGEVQVQPMIDATFPLSEGIAALERAAMPGVLKVLVRP